MFARRQLAIPQADLATDWWTVHGQARLSGCDAAGAQRIWHSAAMPRVESVVVEALAAPRGAYPHARVVGEFVFVSGTSARQPDGSIAGVDIATDGTVTLDIRRQTAAVLDNIATILAAVGSGLDHVVDLTTYLVDMADFGGYNDVYASYFTATSGPTRTTVAVHQLPHPLLLIEIKVVAHRATAQPQRLD